MSEQPDDPGAWRPTDGSFAGDGEEGTIDLSAFLPPPPADESPLFAALVSPTATAVPFDAPPPMGVPLVGVPPPPDVTTAPSAQPPTPSPTTPSARPFNVVPMSPPFAPSGPPPPAPTAAPHHPPEPALFTAAAPPGPSPTASPIPPAPHAGQPLPQRPPSAPAASSASASVRSASPGSKGPAQGKRRQTILLAVLGVMVVGAAVAFFVLRGGDDEAADTVAPATSAIDKKEVPSGGQAPAPAPGAGTSRSGNGTQTIDLTFPEPKPAMAFLALSSTQSGPFSVTAIAADGTRGAPMLETSGPFEGNRMLLPSADGALPAKVEVVAPGAWTLDVRDASTAIQAGVNAGTGSTVLYYRGAGGELGFSHDGPGSFVIRSYQAGQPQDIVSVVGTNQGTAQLPGGPYPIEIVTDGSWLLTAHQ